MEIKYNIYKASKICVKLKWLFSENMRIFFPLLPKGQKRLFGSSVVSDIYVLSVFWMYEGSDLFMTNTVVLIYVELLFKSRL